MGVVIWYGTLVDIDSKARILTVCIGSTNFHSFNVSSYHQMLLDPLNVGLSKTCEENLVIAFSWVFFLVDDEHDFIRRMQISLRCAGGFNKYKEI